MVFAHSAARKNSETDLTGVIFPRLFISWRKLQLSPFTHCPLVSHCQQSPRILCTRCFVPGFLTTAILLIISISGAKILISNFLLDTSLHHSFQSVIIRSYFLLMSLQVIQFEYGLEFFRPSYSLILYNPSKMSSGGIFLIGNKIPSHFESNS